MKQHEPDWDAVFNEFLGPVYNYFLYRVNDVHLAEDLTSTTFVRAWRSRAEYDPGRAPIRTWLFVIAHHVAVDHYRRHRPSSISIDMLADLPDPQPAPESLLQIEFDKKQLGAAIATLPEREQEVIALKYGAEMRNQDIARLLGLSPTNVSSILHRTVQHLRRLMMQRKEIEKHGSR